MLTRISHQVTLAADEPPVIPAGPKHFLEIIPTGRPGRRKFAGIVLRGDDPLRGAGGNR